MLRAGRRRPRRQRLRGIRPEGSVGPRIGCGHGQGSHAATAASNSPVLTTPTGALSGKLNPDVNLVETLNNGQFTVFAPTDEAFGKVDPATIEKLKTDLALLTSVLTYHVVPAQADPSQVATVSTTRSRRRRQ